MRCIKKITEDLTWVGANDRRVAVFEGVYSVPKGVSYNSYLLKDEKNVLFDTVDKAVMQKLVENVEFALNGETLDYLIIQHMELDHSASILEILRLYPDIKIVCNEKTAAMLEKFYKIEVSAKGVIVAENDTLNIGKHTLHFIMAPMVHWPEVMVTYDSTDKILFSADGFGCFGALNGAIFADEVNFNRDYMDEARRYYTNIVGKYGEQVQSLLSKAAAVEINAICPLHGFVWRKNLSDILGKYQAWSSYSPEENGVMVAYASVYGNTENAAEILTSLLREKGVKTEMFDVSMSHASEIIASAFKHSNLVFASTTYNAGIFVLMENLINDLCAHNIQNRNVAIIENGSWAPSSGGLIAEKLNQCKNIKILEKTITINSSLKEEQLSDLESLANEIAKTVPGFVEKDEKEMILGSSAKKTETLAPSADLNALFKLTYGLFVLTAKDGDKDNGCIINTALQVTASPARISIAVNKLNYTCDIIAKTGEFNVSILSEEAKFSVFQQFGFSSGRDADKFANSNYDARTPNGIRYIPDCSNAVISGKVAETIDLGTHFLFIADVVNASILTNDKSVTYQYYFENIKPKPQIPAKVKKGYVCKICGYVHEGDELPADFICPLCKHGAEDFEKI